MLAIRVQAGNSFSADESRAGSWVDRTDDSKPPGRHRHNAPPARPHSLTLRGASR